MKSLASFRYRRPSEAHHGEEKKEVEIEKEEEEEEEEDGIVAGLKQLRDHLLKCGGGGGDLDDPKVHEFAEFRGRSMEREVDLSSEMLDRLSTHLYADTPHAYKSFGAIHEDMHKFYDPAAVGIGEKMLSWVVNLPTKWEAVVPVTAMRRAAVYSEEKFLEYGGCRFHQSELWCQDEKHHSRCANGSPTCCVFHNLASLLNTLLTDTSLDNVPWAALERIGVEESLEGIIACFLYTYNAQMPNDPATPTAPRAQERPVQIYSVLNLCMREVGDPHIRATTDDSIMAIYLQALEILHPLIRRLDVFLKHLPRTSRILYRGLAGHQVSKRYSPGSLITWPAFTSTSSIPDVAWWFTGESGGTWFVILPDDEPAADISWMSMYPVERELLLPCNQILKVAFKPGDSILTTLRTNNDVVILQQVADGDRAPEPHKQVDMHMRSLHDSIAVTFASFKAHYVEPKLSLNTEHAPDEDLVNLFAAVARGDTKKIVITGEAGTGKTSAMLALTSHPEEDVLPIFISLPSLQNVLSPDSPPCLLDVIKGRMSLDDHGLEYLRQHKTLLLLDSLDECIGSNAYLKEPDTLCLLERMGIYLSEWPNMRVVLSTRTEYVRYWGLDATHILGEDTQLLHMQRFKQDHISSYVHKVSKQQVYSMIKMLHKSGIDTVQKDRCSRLVPPGLLLRIADACKENGPVAAREAPVTYTAIKVLGSRLLDIINRLSSDVHNAFQLSMAVEAAPELQCGDGRWQVYSTWCTLQVEKRLRKLSAEIQKYAMPPAPEAKIQYLLEFCETVALSMFKEEEWHGEVGPHIRTTAKMLSLHAETVIELLKTAPLRVEDAENDKSQFSFVHRSVHEYLLARALYRGIVNDNDSVVATILSHWSLACSSANMVDLFGEAVRSGLRENFEESRKVVQFLWYNVQLSRDWTGKGKCSSAVNSMSLLAATGVDLGGADFSGVKIPTARLLGGHFRNSDFRDADLRAVDIREACLDGCDFRGARLDDWVCAYSKMRLPLRIGLLPTLLEQKAVVAIEWSPHKPQMLAVLTKGRVAVHDIDAVRLVGSFTPKTCAPTAMAWHPVHPSSMAVASADGEIVIWDCAKDKSTSVASLRARVTGCVFLEQAAPTLLCTADKSLFKYKLPESDKCRTKACFMRCSTGVPVTKLDFDSKLLGVHASPLDESLVVVWAEDASFSVVDTSTMQVTWRQQLPSVVTDAEFNSAMPHIAVATRAGDLELYCYDAKNFLRTLGERLPFEHYYTNVSWSRIPDGSIPPSTLATVATDSFVRAVCSVTGARFPKAEGRQAEVYAVGWNRTRCVLATGCAEGTVRLINSSNGKEGKGCTEMRESQNHTSTVNTIEWHPSEEAVLATGSHDGTMCTWNVPSGVILAKYGAGGKLRSVRYEPTLGEQLVGADATSVRSHQATNCCGEWVLDKAASHVEWGDKSTLYYLEQDTGVVQTYDPSSKTSQSLSEVTGVVHFSVNPSARGTVAMATPNGVHIVSAQGTKQLTTLPAAEVAWNSDGSKVSTQNDGRILTYETESGRQVGCGCGKGVRWSKVNPSVMAMFEGGTVHVHDVVSGSCKEVVTGVGEIHDLSWHPTLPDVFACSGTSWGVEVYGRGSLGTLVPLLRDRPMEDVEYKLIRCIVMEVFTARGALIDPSTCNANFWTLAKSYGAEAAEPRGRAPSTPCTGTCTTACVRFCTSR